MNSIQSIKYIACALFGLLMQPLNLHADPARDANYGVWESYGAHWHTPLQYPDFRLKFREKKENAFYPGSSSRRLAPIYIFDITAGEKQQELEWSAGTGDIASAKFTVKGKTFFLEMLRSDFVPENVPDHKIVIWTEAEFNRRKQAVFNQRD